MTTVGTEPVRKTARARRAKKTAVADDVGHALVTGYPGFLGRALVARLLAASARARVTLVVLDEKYDAARAAIARLPRPQQKRVRVEKGDVAKMDLGLSGPEIQSLLDDVTHVFHLAAVHHLGVSPDETRAVNVDGTRHALALAREMKILRRFVYFSTCYVSGARTGVIMEDELDEGQSFRNAYERTKHDAERLVRAAMPSLPITILRPSIVVGDSETGEIDRFDGIYQMGILLVASPIAVPLPLPGDGSAPLNVVPVDFVVKAGLALATAADTKGLTFHLVDPSPLAVKKVYERIAARAGKRLPRVRLSYGVARRLLRMPFVERFSRTPAQAVDYLNHLAIYNCSNTLEHLADTGIACPRIDTYLDRLMAFVEHALAERRPPPSPTPLLVGRKDPYAR